jgi:hypothetical protein
MKKWKWKLNIRRVDVERMLVLCAAALVVALALRQEEPAVSYESAALSGASTRSETTVLTAAETQPTVVYYQDGEGYLVPVTRQVDKTDGIAKATLNLMVQSSATIWRRAPGPENHRPEGVKFDLDIAAAKARVTYPRSAELQERRAGNHDGAVRRPELVRL